MKKMSRLLTCGILALAVLALASCGKDTFHID